MLEKIKSYLDLRRELEAPAKIHEEIEKDIVFKGTNIWILVFAIVIASVGLNINSTAVIIGAMLISPLMGPINGIGYSIATYNFELLRRSIKNFSFAVGASLIASTVYFAATPVASAHSELLARTTPTIYDVIIALFGGLAGIVAISSKRKGNVIPGVAIATALMPPLCTAGYGLGTLQFNFFLGAIYLFLINTVFIALAGLGVARLFKFPITTLVHQERRKSISRWIGIITFVTVVPSVYFGYQLVEKERFNEAASKYAKNVTSYEGYYLLNYDIDPDERMVELNYAGSSMTEETKQRIIDLSQDFDITGAKIKVKQGLTLNDNQESGEVISDQVLKETEYLKNNLSAALAQLDLKQQELDSIQAIPIKGKRLLSEVKAMYPEVTSCTYAETYLFADSASVNELTAVVTFSVPKRALKKSDKERLKNWLPSRVDQKNVILFFDESKKGK